MEEEEEIVVSRHNDWQYIEKTKTIGLNNTSRVQTSFFFKFKNVKELCQCYVFIQKFHLCQNNELNERLYVGSIKHFWKNKIVTKKQRLSSWNLTKNVTWHYFLTICMGIIMTIIKHLIKETKTKRKKKTAGKKCGHVMSGRMDTNMTSETRVTSQCSPTIWRLSLKKIELFFFLFSKNTILNIRENKIITRNWNQFPDLGP